MEAKFCLSCGHPLEMRKVDGEDRKACTNCSYVHWGNYSIGVGALVVQKEKVLLVRRAQEPGKGFWTNPGGYIEQLEPIERTIIREVFEECGIGASVKGVVALRDQPRQIHNVYIAFSMEYLFGSPRADGVEVDEAGFFSIEEMKEMNVAGFTKWLVDVALTEGSEGLLMDKQPVVPLDGLGLFRMLKG